MNLANDPTACGACGVSCTGAKSFCDGTCKEPPCDATGGCGGNEQCCGQQCCKTGQLCCKVEGPVGGGPPTCFTPTAEQRTCPQGCAPLCVSDRNLKHDVEPVDPRVVLDAVSRLPLATWSYKSDPQHTRHLGPMAQDFKAELGLGATDRAYDPIDAHGAAFASIQALRAMLDEQNARILRLEEENRALQRRLDKR